MFCFVEIPYDMFFFSSHYTIVSDGKNIAAVDNFLPLLAAFFCGGIIKNEDLISMNRIALFFRRTFLSCEGARLCFCVMKKAFQFLLSFSREAGKTITAFLFAAVAIGAVFAFQEPSVAPPGGTVYTPVNIGSAAQTKSGSLSVLGNLGIGTQLPTAKLQVGSGTSIWGGGAHLDLVGFRPGDGAPVATLSFSPSSTKGWHQNADTAGSMSFYTFRGGSWAPVLVLRENGNIGIGNTAGNARLHLRGDNASASDYTFFSEYEGRALFEVRNDGNAGLGVADPNDYVSSPKGTGGYLNVKDVWLRDIGKWASQASGGGGFGGMYRSAWYWKVNTEEWAYPSCLYTNPFTGGCSCPPGFSASLFNRQVWARDAKEEAYYCYKI